MTDPTGDRAPSERSDAASPDEARAFADAFRSFLEWVHQPQSEGNEVVRLVREHLGPERVDRSVVGKDLPLYEQVNLQTALDSWSSSGDRSVEVHGISCGPHWQRPTLAQLTTGDGLPPIRLSAPELVDLPNGPSSTLACFALAVLLVHDELGSYVVMVRGPVPHQEPTLTVEVAGLEVAQAQALHASLAALRSSLNVYRGHVVEFGTDQIGGTSLSFAALPLTRREDVVLPEPVLRRVERHALDIAHHRDALLAAGQHLKRGLLLYGPPGTGKTHTTRYVLGAMEGYTRLLLSGRTLHLVGAVTSLARELAPAVVVLEDVDLVAEDRSFGPGSSPVLFELLDAMDGAAADADLLFLLTTNRADLLEPALAGRPGRVDVAVEIALPDADARERLFRLYSRGVPLQIGDDEISDVVERSAGTTASFVKELLRRAVLEALTEQHPLTEVTGEHVRCALDDLLDASQTVTRALLGAGSEGNPPPLHPRPAGPAGGWVAVPGRMPAAYSSSLTITTDA